MSGTLRGASCLQAGKTRSPPRRHGQARHCRRDEAQEAAHVHTCCMQRLHEAEGDAAGCGRGPLGDAVPRGAGRVADRSRWDVSCPVVHDRRSLGAPLECSDRPDGEKRLQVGNADVRAALSVPFSRSACCLAYVGLHGRQQHLPAWPERLGESPPGAPLHHPRPLPARGGGGPGPRETQPRKQGVPSRGQSPSYEQATLPAARGPHVHSDHVAHPRHPLWPLPFSLGRCAPAPGPAKCHPKQPGLWRTVLLLHAQSESGRHGGRVRHVLHCAQEVVTRCHQ